MELLYTLTMTKSIFVLVAVERKPSICEMRLIKIDEAICTIP